MQSCAVIGCGPAGMAAATLLRQSGLMVTCFELEARPGGMWSYNSRDLFSSRGAVSALYPTMRCVLPKDFMSFSDVRFDYTVPQFPHHSAVLRYLDTYAEQKGVLGMTRFNTKVESIRLDERNQLWKLITVNVLNGDVMEWSFEKVCVCTGQTQRPRYPPELKENTLNEYMAAGGEVHHTSHVKDFRSFKGKRVVVLGDGVSAYDYCAELKHSGADVYHSTMLGQMGDPTTCGPAASAYSAPQRPQPSGDGTAACQAPGAHPAHPTASDCVTFEAMALWRHSPERDGAHGTSELLKRWLRYRTVYMEGVPRVGHPIQADGKGILFADDVMAHLSVDDAVAEATQRALSGASAETDTVGGAGIFIDAVDAVISATGFMVQYPFLHPEMRATVEDTRTLLPEVGEQAGNSSVARPASSRGLFLGTLYVANPSIAFVGAQRELLPPFLLMEAQARFVAYAFTGRVQLPTTADGLREMEAAIVAENPLLANLYSATGLGLHSAAYFNVLQQQLGVSSKETYTAMILRRKWWALASSTLRIYHKLRSMAPLRRKKQHVLFSNQI